MPYPNMNFVPFLTPSVAHFKSVLVTDSIFSQLVRQVSKQVGDYKCHILQLAQSRGSAEKFLLFDGLPFDAAPPLTVIRPLWRALFLGDIAASKPRNHMLETIGKPSSEHRIANSQWPLSDSGIVLFSGIEQVSLQCLSNLGEYWDIGQTHLVDFALSSQTVVG